MKVEPGTDTFYNIVIDKSVKKKNWIGLQMNFDNPLFKDFIIFSCNQ